MCIAQLSLQYWSTVAKQSEIHKVSCRFTPKTFIMCNSSVKRFFSQWRLWIRPLLIAIYVIVIVVLVPILIAHSIRNGFSKSDQGALVGGGFVLLALPISVWQITQHIVHYTKPSLQKHIIRYVHTLSMNVSLMCIFLCTYLFYLGFCLRVHT